MARPLLIEYPGALYHVTARGDGQASPWAELTGQVFLGAEAFVLEVAAKGEPSSSGEVPRA